MVLIRHCERPEVARQPRAAHGCLWIATGLAALAMTTKREI